MKRFLLLLLPAIALLATPACKRSDSSMNTVTPGGFASLDDLFERTAQLPTTQSIIVASGGEVTSKGGTRIVFQKNCFQSYSTGAIITGSVDVTITDWLKRGDMVFSKVLPISNSYAMTTAGQCYVEVTQNGVPVRLRKGYKAFVIFPQFGRAITVGDSLYLGRKIAGSVNTVDWYAQDTAGQFGVIPTDTLVMATDSLRYIAASRFLPVPSYSNFAIRINAPTDLEQSIAVALFDFAHGVYPISSLNNGTTLISAQRIPALQMHVAVMGVNKGRFYGGIQPILNPQTDSTYQVELKEKAPQAFRLEMNAL